VQDRAPELAAEAVHEDPVVDAVADAACLSPPADFFVAGPAIAADGALVVAVHLEHAVVQAQDGEAVIQHQDRRLGPIPLAPAASLPDADVVFCSALGVVDGELPASSELQLHLGVYRRYHSGAVVHAHSPVATALSCVLDELPVVHYQMLLLGGPVRVAPYATFGSAELAELTLDALADRGGALMANHGAITHGEDLDVALSQSLLLEWACTVYWHAAAIGSPRVLDVEERSAVVDAAVQRGYGTTHRIHE